jgi:hypothetical protein
MGVQLNAHTKKKSRPLPKCPLYLYKTRWLFARAKLSICF